MLVLRVESENRVARYFKRDDAPGDLVSFPVLDLSRLEPSAIRFDSRTPVQVKLNLPRGPALKISLENLRGETPESLTHRIQKPSPRLIILFEVWSNNVVSSAVAKRSEGSPRERGGVEKTIDILDPSGKEIEPTVMFDAQTHASPNDKEAFLKLGSNHFIGTTFFSPLEFLNLTKPRKYAIVAEYNCPFANAEVGLKPFLSKENGPIKSNTVWIELVR